MKRAAFPVSVTAVATALLAMGGPAGAQEAGVRPSIGVHGFFNTVVGVTGSQDWGPSSGGVDSPMADIKPDVEIHFDGRARLDSGVSIRAHIELEGNTATDQIDEAYVILRGGFGQFTLGMENGAAEMMTVGYGGNSASVGVHYYLDTTDFLAARSWAGVTSTTGVAEYFTDDDEAKITYYTPRLFGVQIGASFIPSFRGDDTLSGPSSGNDRYRDAYSLGVSYEGRLAGVGIGIGAGYLAAATPNDYGTTKSDWNEYSVAGRLDVGPLRLATGFRAIVDGADYGSWRSAEGQAVNFGVRYTMGLNAVSFNYVTGYTEGLISNAAEHKSTYVKLSAQRTLGEGVTGHLNWASADWQGEEAGPSDDNAGWAVMAGLNVGF